MSEDLPLAAQLLMTLAQLQGSSPDAVSLPRLGKHLGQGASVLMRGLNAMSDAQLGGVQGPGWVQLHHVDGHWRAGLTEAGRAVAQELRQAPSIVRLNSASRRHHITTQSAQVAETDLGCDTVGATQDGVGE